MTGGFDTVLKAHCSEHGCHSLSTKQSTQKGALTWAHLWPKPNIFSLRFLTPSMNLGMLSVVPIRSSMRKTASLAPPCRGPYNAPTAPTSYGSMLSTSNPLQARYTDDGHENWSKHCPVAMHRAMEYKAHAYSPSMLCLTIFCKQACHRNQSTKTRCRASRRFDQKRNSTFCRKNCTALAALARAASARSQSRRSSNAL